LRSFKDNCFYMSRTVVFKFATMLLSFFLAYESKAQVSFKDIHKIQISASMDVYSKINVGVNGENILRGRFSPTPKLVLNYSYYIKDILGLNAGLGFTIIPYHVGIKHPVDYPITIFGDSVPNPDYYYFYKHYVYTLPFSIEKHFQLSKQHYFSAQLGVEMNFVLNYPYNIGVGYSTGFPDKYFLQIELHESKSRVLFAYFFKIGYYKQFTKGNTLGFNFKLNYSPQLLGVGTYKFSNFPYESYGDLKWDINHVGLEMVYGFLPIKNKKKLKKESEIEKF